MGRAAAPAAEDIDRIAARFSLTLPADLPTTSGSAIEIEIEWAGDVAQLLVDGVVTDDRFWDGSPWVTSLGAVPVTAETTIEVRIVPLHPKANVHLPADAEALRRRTPEPLGQLQSVRLREQQEARSGSRG